MMSKGFGFLPGAEEFSRLFFLVDLYLTDPLEWDVELVHRIEDLPAVTLGRESGARLGWDSWLGRCYLRTDGYFSFQRFK